MNSYQRLFRVRDSLKAALNNGYSFSGMNSVSVAEDLVRNDADLETQSVADIARDVWFIHQNDTDLGITLWP